MSLHTQHDLNNVHILLFKKAHFNIFTYKATEVSPIVQQTQH